MYTKMSVVSFGPHHVDDESTRIALKPTSEWTFVKQQDVTADDCISSMNETLKKVSEISPNKVPRTVVEEIRVRAAHTLCLLFTKYAPPADEAGRTELASTVFNISLRVTDDTLVGRVKKMNDLASKEEGVIHAVGGLICDPTPFHYACMFVRNDTKDERERSFRVGLALSLLSGACSDIGLLAVGPEALGRAAASNSSFQKCGMRFKDGPPYGQSALALVDALYTVGQCIGKGTYGEVFKARRKETQDDVALKYAESPKEDKGHTFATLCEWGALALLERANSEHIVRLLDVVKDPRNGKIIFALEHCDTTLHDILFKSDVLMSQEQVLKFATHLFSGLATMHSLGVAHRDIKPRNLLIKNGVLKIADMGASTATELGRARPLSLNVQTIWWRAPEVLVGNHNYFLSADMWSAGVTMVEMATKAFLFNIGNNDPDIKVLKKQVIILGSPSPTSQHSWLRCASDSLGPLYATLNIRQKELEKDVVDARLGLVGKSEAWKAVVYGCLTFDPEQRWNAHEALETLTGTHVPTPTAQMDATRIAVQPLQNRAHKRAKVETTDEEHDKGTI